MQYDDVKWTTSVCDSGFARKMCEKYLPQVTATNGAHEALYTMEQMTEMFQIAYRLGYDEQETRKKEDEFNHSIRKVGSTRFIRSLAVGEAILLPFEKWQVARSAASAMHRLFGCIYHVNKLGPPGKKGDIRVLRIK